ncbi:MAG: transcriptional regulator, partial [Burkholderiales bacterium]|nr:transcriptional regulator [Burkholderiales bacterium]
LRISATHSFAIKWLVPRLHRFTEQYPELDIRVDANDQRVALDDDSTDIAIRYSKTVGDDATVLFNEVLVVAYSPALLPPGRSDLTLADLPDFPLLYEGTTASWIALLNANKVLQQQYNFSRCYSHAGVLVQAAVAGQGIALVPYTIAFEDVAKGALKLLPCRSAPYDRSYCLLVNRFKEGMPKIAHFRSWIQGEMNAMARMRPT